MIKNVLFVLLVFATGGFAVTRDELVRYVPRDSFIVISADFSRLKDNEVFQSMHNKGQVWSYEENSDINKYFQVLKLDPKKDLRAFVFSRYVNSYGSSGKLHVLDLFVPVEKIQGKSETKYLDSSLVRLSDDGTMFAVRLSPTLLAVGNLNEVKMAVDVARNKVSSLVQSPTLHALYQKLPEQAAVWGIALPLNRRTAASVKAKQSTNAILSGFENYYFYGIPSRTAANTHFIGQTPDEKQAAFATAFMTGTLLVAKFRADESLAQMLDEINIQQSGKSVHLTAVVTREMVDAFFDGKLGL